jgi:hypothetical protein
MVSGIWQLILLGKQEDLKPGRQWELTPAEKEELRRLFTSEPSIARMWELIDTSKRHELTDDENIELQRLLVQHQDLVPLV